MKYKLIATDYDYTLASINHKASSYTKEVINQYIKQGGLFTIATGRMTNGLLANLDGVNVNAPVITYQGAKVVDAVSCKVLKHYGISPALASEFISRLARYDCPINVYINDTLYVEKYYQGIERYIQANKINYNIAPNGLADLIIKTNQPCSKILALLEEDLALKLEQQLGQEYKGKLNITRSAPTFLETNDILASKGRGVEFIADLYNIKRENIMCFGDSTNDISMLKFAGLGVAVGNAMPEVLETADIICENYDQDGLAHTIEKYCLTK
ncbi:MAG: Cof-type HAD-IIB family hydrolase [Clostridia bacterium]